MSNHLSPLERLNVLERSVSQLLNESIGVTSEQVIPEKGPSLPVWTGGEHLLLRCYKRLPQILSEYRLPADLQKNNSGQIELTLSTQKGIFYFVVLDCGNSVILLDCELARQRGLKFSNFKDLFDLHGLNHDEIHSTSFSCFPYFSPVEYGRRWILDSPGSFITGASVDGENRCLDDRANSLEIITRELSLQQREQTAELRSLKSDLNDVKRQIKEISYLIISSCQD